MIRACLALLLMAAPAAALDLSLPATARLTAERNTNPDVYAAPVGVFAEGQVARINVEGEVRRAAWRLSAPGLTPLQVMRPLRAQLKAAGLEIVLDCAAETCGGFDFRFASETLPGPNMYVNIRAFHFVTALRLDQEDAPQEVVTVLTSTSATAAYVQVIQAGMLNGGAAAVAATADVPVTTQAITPEDLSGALLARGHVVLRDLDFESGTSDLGRGPFASLEKLAAFLKSRPNIRVALVGHTDSIGGLGGNIALSKRRAQSVRRRMIDLHGIGASRMEAEGMGYLSPVASNLDASGRDANRRVEVILLGE